MRSESSVCRMYHASTSIGSTFRCQRDFRRFGTVLGIFESSADGCRGIRDTNIEERGVDEDLMKT